MCCKRHRANIGCNYIGISCNPEKGLVRNTAFRKDIIDNCGLKPVKHESL